MTDINHIEYKKPFYKIKAHLKEHLGNYSRLCNLPIEYEDLLHFNDLVPALDQNDNPTLWYCPIYRQSEMTHIHESLLRVYQLLVADGDPSAYLQVAGIEFCSFGNSKPFRIKIKNDLNDNHDYFYVKRADASRVYGLELEEIFSPDKVSFLVNGNTLIEEHIVGIPCDEFILKNENVQIENRLRFAKEFVKFNERCFVRLLGDMRAYNFVVEITPDFDNVQYRIRPIDFDQQCYEGRKSIYLPQYYKDNSALVNLAVELLNDKSAKQYIREEHAAMKKRFLAARQRTRSIIRRMRKDKISSPENIQLLAQQLAKHHNSKRFEGVNNMGDILVIQLEIILGIEVMNEMKQNS